MSAHTFIFLICFCSFIARVECQEKPVRLDTSGNVPEYIKLIQRDHVNVFEIERAFKRDREQTGIQKNSFTQYYKRWMQWSRARMKADGSVEDFSADDYQNEERIRRQLRKDPGVHPRNGAGNWSFAGPAKTYHTDGSTKVTWQTNIYCMDVAPSNQNIVYAGGESGGLWKSTDKGLNWTLTTRNVMHDAFSSVQVHPSDPNTVFAGTSTKIIRTKNGGQDWETIYTENGLEAYDLEIQRSNPKVIFAATNAGLLRSTDGGSNWTKLWTTITWTIRIHTGDPSKMYAVRKNGNTASLMISIDSGTSWTDAGERIYKADPGIVVSGALIALCPSNPEKMYAYLCGEGGSLYGYIGVFVSDDGGSTWLNTNPQNAIGGTYQIPGHTNLMANDGAYGFNQGFYDMAIVVNPQNENELIAGGTSWFKSVDGGASWQPLGGYVGNLPWSHPDIQCLVAAGTDLWIASDGGINYSSNFGKSMEARMDGISGADLWGFDSGWNDDILVGGRYHNGNMAWYEQFPNQTFYRMGGAEAPTGYVNPGPGRKTYFSDIGGQSLVGGFTEGIRSFPVGLFPNESYAYYANSEMCWHPACWNILYLGRENKLWKSEDGGATFKVLYTFPGSSDRSVFEIEVCRSNPSVMYCSQWDGTDDAIWRSEDEGKSWVKCKALPLPNNNDRVKMTVSAISSELIWVAVSYGSNGKKVYKSTDGGRSWINLTTAVLDNVRISDILHAAGTEGGIYLGTNRGVFYRNEQMADWIPYSDGLPISAETNRLKAFYRDGKIRNGCWGFGVWESALFEESQVIPQIMTDKLTSQCLRDTFYFDDHSIVKHKDAHWSWSFDDVLYQSGQNERSVRVLFKSSGTKRVLMTLETPKGFYYDTLWVEVKDECNKDSLPGQALYLGGNASYVLAKAPGFSTNKMTMMAWVKSEGTQKDWCAILFSRSSGQASGISLLSNGDIRYHWGSGGYNWNSGARLEPGVWTHIALVIEPNSATIYKDGVPYVHRTTLAAGDFYSAVSIGADLNGGDRFFKGWIDEACIYNRSLSQNEIREIMHLTRTHTAVDGLVSYYQFNDGSDKIFDRQGSNHGTISGTATLAPSYAPVGPGFSKRLNLNSNGLFDFSPAGLTVELPQGGSFPNGEICVSRINYIPSQYFNPDQKPVSPSYWIFHNFGSNRNFTPFRSVKFDDIGPVSSSSGLNDYHLYSRPVHADTSTWSPLGFSTNRFSGNQGTAVFEQVISSEGQLLVSKIEGDTLVVKLKEVTPEIISQGISIYPNPVFAKSQPFHIQCNWAGPVRGTLLDAEGKIIRRFVFERSCSLDISNLNPGSYFCIFEHETRILCKELMLFQGH